MSWNLFKGRVRHVRSFPGARFVAVSHAPNSAIGAHQHDWPNLTIHLAGACIEQFDGASAFLDGPSAVFHPGSSGHADEILSAGLETVGILFDPDWLARAGCRDMFDRPWIWNGGRAALAARRLVAVWSNSGATEACLMRATADVLRLPRVKEPSPSWLEFVTGTLSHDFAPTTQSIARSLNLHPAWLARRYRQVTGEGLHETLRRRRVERALVSLRTSDSTLAEVAIDAGFCDQPHMNRCFRQVLGRTPQAYRLDARAD